jgi:hypothetical protein
MSSGFGELEDSHDDTLELDVHRRRTLIENIIINTEDTNAVGADSGSILHNLIVRDCEYAMSGNFDYLDNEDVRTGDGHSGATHPGYPPCPERAQVDMKRGPSRRCGALLRRRR